MRSESNCGVSVNGGELGKYVKGIDDLEGQTDEGGGGNVLHMLSRMGRGFFQRLLDV